MATDAKIEAVGTETIGYRGLTGAHLGGAVGYQEDGSLSGYSLVSVHGLGSNIGGFLGYGESFVVSGYATGDVSGLSEAGGLVGQLYKATIIASYATGDVTATGDHVGGLLGTGQLFHHYQRQAMPREMSLVNPMLADLREEPTSTPSAAMPREMSLLQLIVLAGLWETASAPPSAAMPREMSLVQAMLAGS